MDRSYFDWIPPTVAAVLFSMGLFLAGAYAQEAPEVPAVTTSHFEQDMRRREVRALESQARQTERLVRVMERIDRRCQ
jgi:hypothetical protein